MIMIEGLELPIRGEPISGPAVDANESRREENNHPRITTEFLLSGYESIRVQLLDEFQSLVSK